MQTMKPCPVINKYDSNCFYTQGLNLYESVIFPRNHPLHKFRCTQHSWRCFKRLPEINFIIFDSEVTNPIFSHTPKSTAVRGSGIRLIISPLWIWRCSSCAPHPGLQHHQLHLFAVASHWEAQLSASIPNFSRS